MRYTVCSNEWHYPWCFLHGPIWLHAEDLNFDPHSLYHSTCLVHRTLLCAVQKCKKCHQWWFYGVCALSHCHIGQRAGAAWEKCDVIYCTYIGVNDVCWPSMHDPILFIWLCIHVIVHMLLYSMSLCVHNVRICMYVHMLVDAYCIGIFNVCLAGST